MIHSKITSTDQHAKVGELLRLCDELEAQLNQSRTHGEQLLAAALRQLRHQPAKESKSRIKRLRQMRRPQYRLRVDEIRVFYDIHGPTVEVLAIVPKSETVAWLEQMGEPE